jgi:two-component system sensor histidine kinase HydH
MGMRGKRQSAIRWAVAAAVLVLPVVLMLSALRSLREMPDNARLYLRSRAATLAARLENLHPDQVGEELTDMLAAEEPGLIEARVYRSAEEEPDNTTLQRLWNGEELFHTEEIVVDGERIFRTYIPFHLDGTMRIARLDLAMDSADFLWEHTRHHLAISLAASIALVGFTAYFLWSEQRTIALERQQHKLERLAQLGEMSAVLAHEIRNPLGTIKGFVQLAIEKTTAPVRSLLDPVLDETARLERLVNDLLLYGRPRTPELRPVDWATLAERMDIYARDLIGERNVRYAREGGVTELRTDPEMLEQALLNLIRNAVEAVAGRDGGEVVLAAESRPGAVSIRVEDNGPGLPEEVRGRAYEPFMTTKSNGTGLGLPIVKKLAESLGGRIELGERPAGGTRAELTLPT